MVVDAHPYVVNALAVCTATAEASAKVSAPMSDLMRRCLEEELPPACSPLPADSTFRALFNGEIRIHQGASHAHTQRMRQLTVTQLYLELFWEGSIGAKARKRAVRNCLLVRRPGVAGRPKP